MGQGDNVNMPDESGGSVIAQGTRVRGRVTGDGDLVIQGTLDGDVVLRGQLRIEPGAVVVSNVEAEDVLVAGSLDGNVESSGTIRVASGASLRGDIRAGSLAFEDGARFSGRIDCAFDLPKELAKPAPARRT